MKEHSGTGLAGDHRVKVIIQEVESNRYLSGNGQWVNSATIAEDFITILQAYTFAKNYTSGPFRVVLHDEDYSKDILEGVGVDTAGGVAYALQPVAAVAPAPRVARNRPQRLVNFGPRYYDLRNYRN